MQRHQAFKYQLMPTGEQQRQLRCFAGCCRFVFNKALAWQKARYERGESHLSYNQLATQLVQWKGATETAWLKQSPSQALQQVLRNLDQAYTHFFQHRAGFPRFKKKGQRDRVRYPQGIKLDQANHRLFLPKLGWIRYRHSRDVLGTVKHVTVSQSCGQWFVSMQTERDVALPTPHGPAVGIDLGIARFATLSDGTYYAPLNRFKHHQAQLRKVQRSMSRKVTFSRNWQKAKARVQRIHAHIGYARHDYLHKCSSTLSQNHAMVCIEDLQIRNMSRSAAGTTEKPGKHVRAKSGLNKSILDQGWFEFRRQLAYKLAWNGGYLVAVPPQNTSRTCPKCGHVAKDNRKTQAQFCCAACGFNAHADVVGAINILRAGHARFACEVSDAVRSPAAGTHRSDLTAVECCA